MFRQVIAIIRGGGHSALEATQAAKRVHTWLHSLTTNHTGRIVIHTHPQYRPCLSSFQGTTTLPDDGNYLPKHVGENLKMHQ
jgi:hypothetical protein